MRLAAAVHRLEYESEACARERRAMQVPLSSTGLSRVQRMLETQCMPDRQRQGSPRSFRCAVQEQLAAVSSKVVGAERAQAALQKLQDELHRQQAGREEACRLTRQSEVHAELDRVLLSRAQAERERDSHHLVLALQQLLGATGARKGHATEGHKRCRSCRRRVPA